MSETSVSTATAVSVNLLGSFTLRIGGDTVHKWRAGKARSLFQYLLLHRGRLVLRDKLHDVLWPDTDWSPNSSSLKVAMHAVRQLLGAGADGSAEHGVRIVHQDYGYALHADDVWVDVEEFEALIEQGRAADKAGDTAAALHAYRGAMALYQGDFLGSETADWVIEQREWCKSLALRALDRLSAEALRRGDFDELVRWCRRIIDIDPYRESAYRMLMQVHGRFGELGSVRRWHDMCMRRLAGELGVEPDDETELAYAEAMRSRHSTHSGHPVTRTAREVHTSGGLAPVASLAAARRSRAMSPVPVRSAS